MVHKYVFVTGAAGGIGKATCLFLAAKGFHVFAGDWSKELLSCFSDNKIIPVQVDITNPESIEEAVKVIKSHTSYINGIINIAGKFDQFPLIEVEPRSFEDLINVNLIGQQSITRALFPLLSKAKGKVINLSSETVLAQMPLQAYGFSKKLFDVWNTQLRIELKLLGMDVIVVRAGGHQTPFIDQSIEVIKDVSQNSGYSKLMIKIKDQAHKMLLKPQSDPSDLARVFYKALTASKPKKRYNVNVSLLFRLLSALPMDLREYFMIRQLKKWM